MIRSGDTLYNPVTGESMTFVTTSRETDGEYVEIELTADPGAFVAAAHVHPSQTETFAVLQGTLGVEVDGSTRTAGNDEVVVVEPGQAHKWWNAGESKLVFRCEIRPALQFEQLIETMFALAAAGKTNKRGLPNPFRLAVIARAHLDTVVLPFPPVCMQKAALAVGAPVGRLLGYAATYEPAPAPISLAPAVA
jgi:quercetin dioxygenase-like cupin family protein